MQLRKDTFLNNRVKRGLYIVSAFFVLYLVSYLLDPYSPYWEEFFKRDLSNILIDLTNSLIFCVLISEFSIRGSNLLNTHITWTESPGKRLLLEILLNLVNVLIMNVIMSQICSYQSGEELFRIFWTNISIEETRGFLQWIVVSVLISFMISGINTGNYLIINWKNAAMKAAELNQVAMEAELQSLKLQIDPHFVFNNLSVLSELILEDQQVGYDYAENFSKIYRYLLVNSKKDVISLEEELKFLNSYRFLIKHRAGEGVQFAIEVNPASRNLYLPPLTLQLLIENALKHNKTTKKEPLQIRIYSTEKDELIVENALMPVEKTLESSGIGIRNIIRRYNLLSDKEPEIVVGPTTFKVTLPLLKL